MPVIGIDPARVSGYAVCSRNGTLLEAGELDLRSSFQAIRDFLDVWWNDDEPYPSSLLAIEDVWLGKNPRTMRSLAMLLGRLQEAAETRGYKVVYVLPAEWRAASGIATRGEGSKRKSAKPSSLRIAKMRFPAMAAQITTDNVADAIGVAVWAAGTVRMGEIT